MALPSVTCWRGASAVVALLAALSAPFAYVAAGTATDGDGSGTTGAGLSEQAFVEQFDAMQTTDAFQQRVYFADDTSVDVSVAAGTLLRDVMDKLRAHRASAQAVTEGADAGRANSASTPTAPHELQGAEAADVRVQVYLGALLAPRMSGALITAVTTLRVGNGTLALGARDGEALENAAYDFAVGAELLKPPVPPSVLPEPRDIDLTLRRAVAALGSAARLPASSLPVFAGPPLAEVTVTMGNAAVTVHLLPGESAMEALSGTMRRTRIGAALSPQNVDDALAALLEGKARTLRDAGAATMTHRSLEVRLTDAAEPDVMRLVYAVGDDAATVVRDFAAIVPVQMNDVDMAALRDAVHDARGTPLTRAQAEAAREAEAAAAAARVSAAATGGATLTRPAPFVADVVPQELLVPVIVGAQEMELLLPAATRVEDAARDWCAERAAAVTRALRAASEATGAEDDSDAFVPSGACARLVEAFIRHRAAIVFAVNA